MHVDALRRSDQLDRDDAGRIARDLCPPCARRSAPSRHGPPGRPRSESNRRSPGKARLLFSLTSAAAVTCGIIRPEFTPESWVRKAGRPLIFGSIRMRGAAFGQGADLAQRHGDHVGGEGDRLGVEIAARDGRVLVREDDRIVGHRGASMVSVRAACRAGRARRPSPAAGSGSCRGPAPRPQRFVAGEDCRCRRAARGARRRRGFGRAGREARETRASNGLTEPFSASTDIAPAAIAAANTRSPREQRIERERGRACVPLISARPSLDRAASGAMPRRSAPRGADMTSPATSMRAVAHQRGGHVGERGEVADAPTLPCAGISGMASRSSSA